MAGFIQGAVSYAKYCDQDIGTYSYNYNVYSDFKYCDFGNADRQHDPDVDFLTVVIVSGIAAFSWVSDNCAVIAIYKHICLHATLALILYYECICVHNIII